MKDDLLALNTWREQALSRGIEKNELPSAFELGVFLRTKDDPEKWQDKPALAKWSDSLTKLLQAVATGNFVKGTPLPDLFFRPNGTTTAPAEESTPPAPKLKRRPSEAERRPKPAPEPEPQPEPTPVPEPKAEPVPEPKAEPEPTPAPAQLTNLRPDDFAQRDVLEGDPEQLPGGEVTVRARADESGTLEVSWVAPSSGAAVRIFRVVSLDMLLAADGLEPTNGRVRAITSGRMWIDDERVERAVRTFHVWVNEGATEAEALRAQPKVVGVAVYVRPVDDFQVTFEDGRIYGSYAEVDGTSSVEIALLDQYQGLVEQFSKEKNLRGFQMDPKYTGRTYVFQVRRVVDKHTSVYSEEQAVEVPAELTRISPLIQREGERFAVSWTSPGAGEVRIYRSAQPVVEGAAGQLVDADNLAEYGLLPGDWYNRLAPAAKTDIDLDWKSDAFAMYITAVNVVENQAMIGDTQSWVRCGKAENVRIAERVNEQVITFAWPDQASGVEFLHTDPESKQRLDLSSAEAIKADDSVIHIDRISESQYRRFGGFRADLQRNSCLILMPYRSHQGKTVYGEPTLVDYPGLIKLGYHIFPSASNPQQLLISITAEEQRDTTAVSFVLLAQEGFLPIDATRDDRRISVQRVSADGSPLEDSRKIFRTSKPRTLNPATQMYDEPDLFAINMSELRGNGYLRLFLYTPSGGYQPVEDDPFLMPEAVLLDPAPQSLYYGVQQPAVFNPEQPEGTDTGHGQEEPEGRRGFFGRRKKR